VRNRSVVAVVGDRDGDRDHLALGAREPGVAAEKIVVVAPPAEKMARADGEDPCDVRDEADLLPYGLPDLALDLLGNVLLVGDREPGDPIAQTRSPTSNCSSSVEPRSASVELSPAEAACETRSK